MREYELKNEANRIKLAEERAVFKFQQKQAEGIYMFICIYIYVYIFVYMHMNQTSRRTSSV
jgi:hypothetical protein